MNRPQDPGGARLTARSKQRLAPDGKACQSRTPASRRSGLTRIAARIPRTSISWGGAPDGAGVPPPDEQHRRNRAPAAAGRGRPSRTRTAVHADSQGARVREGQRGSPAANVPRLRDAAAQADTAPGLFRAAGQCAAGDHCPRVPQAQGQPKELAWPTCRSRSHSHIWNAARWFRRCAGTCATTTESTRPIRSAATTAFVGGLPTHFSYRFIDMVEASIFDMKAAAAGALSKLAIDASASLLERQCTITSHSPPSPAALSRDTKPG